MFYSYDPRQNPFSTDKHGGTRPLQSAPNAIPNETQNNLYTNTTMVSSQVHIRIHVILPIVSSDKRQPGSMTRRLPDLLFSQSVTQYNKKLVKADELTSSVVYSSSAFNH